MPLLLYSYIDYLKRRIDVKHVELKPPSTIKQRTATDNGDKQSAQPTARNSNNKHSSKKHQQQPPKTVCSFTDQFQAPGRTKTKRNHNILAKKDGFDIIMKTAIPDFWSMHYNEISFNKYCDLLCNGNLEFVCKQFATHCSKDLDGTYDREESQIDTEPSSPINDNADETEKLLFQFKNDALASVKQLYSNPAMLEQIQDKRQRDRVLTTTIANTFPFMIVKWDEKKLRNAVKNKDPHIKQLSKTAKLLRKELYESPTTASQSSSTSDSDYESEHENPQKRKKHKPNSHSPS